MWFQTTIPFASIIAQHVFTPKFWIGSSPGEKDATLPSMYKNFAFSFHGSFENKIIWTVEKLQVSNLLGDFYKYYSSSIHSITNVKGLVGVAAMGN